MLIFMLLTCFASIAHVNTEQLREVLSHHQVSLKIFSESFTLTRIWRNILSSYRHKLYLRQSFTQNLLLKNARIPLCFVQDVFLWLSFPMLFKCTGQFISKFCYTSFWVFKNCNQDKMNKNINDTIHKYRPDMNAGKCQPQTQVSMLWGSNHCFTIIMWQVPCGWSLSSRLARQTLDLWPWWVPSNY